MIRTVDAVIDAEGNVRLIEEIQLPGPRRARTRQRSSVKRRSPLTGAGRRRTRRGCTYSRRHSTGAVSLLGPIPSEAAAAVVLADASRGDWILCQLTSNPYGDTHAVELTDASFASGSLRRDSYARPRKLFTANRDLMIGPVGSLRPESLGHVVEAVIAILRGGATP